MRTYATQALCRALACLFSPTAGAQKPVSQVAQVVRYAPGQSMPDRYIVTLPKGVADVPAEAEAEAVMRGRGGRVHQHFKHGFRGFTATIPASELERVRKQPHVLAVEPDQMVQLNQAVSIERQAPGAWTVLTRWTGRSIRSMRLRTPAPGSQHSLLIPASAPTMPNLTAGYCRATAW